MSDEVRMIDADALKVILNKVEEESERDWFKGNEFREMIDITPTIEAEPDNGWISVEDRLPEPYEKVLVFGDFDNIVNYRVDYLDVYGIWIHSFHVTHWQYLPEPPKGE